MTATRERAATMPGVDVSAFQTLPRVGIAGRVYTDRKSTRLNSSHGYISYAVFCLKKKKKHKNRDDPMPQAVTSTPACAVASAPPHLDALRLASRPLHALRHAAAWSCDAIARDRS